MEHENDFYRPDGAPKEPASGSTEELAKHKELTDSILANLKIIREIDSAEVNALAHRLSNIVQALTLVREFAAASDLVRLELRIASISTALRLIESDETVQELKAER